MNMFFESIKPLASDLFSTLAFAVLLATTKNTTLATTVGMTVGIAQIVLARLRHKSTTPMQMVSLGLIIVLGGLTLYLHDARFMMAKFTIVHVAVGSVMLQPGWLNRYMPKIVTDNLPSAEVTAYGAIWSAMMFGLAIANLYIGFNMSHRVWALFLAVAPAGAPLTLFAVQSLVIRTRVVANIRKQLAMQVD